MSQQYCSFCHRSQDEVQRLIAGPEDVHICDECVVLCNDILQEEGLNAKPDAVEPVTFETRALAARDRQTVG